MSTQMLITGVTGNIGVFLVEQLAAQSVPFQVLVRTRKKAESFRARGIQSFVGDFALPETLPAALDGVEKLFMLSPGEPDQAALQSNMIKAAQVAGVRHIVKLSASCAAPDLPAPIKRAHHQTEQQVIRTCIPYTFLRPNCFMQNTLKWARWIRDEGLFYMPVGDALVSQVDVRDIAAVAAAVLTGKGHEGETYEITGGAAISFDQVAEDLSAVLNRKVCHVRTSFEESRRQMVKAGMDEWLAGAVTHTYRFMSQDNASHVTDVVERLTGRAPISFRQFASDYADVFKTTAPIVSGHSAVARPTNQRPQWGIVAP